MKTSTTNTRIKAFGSEGSGGVRPDVSTGVSMLDKSTWMNEACSRVEKGYIRSNPLSMQVKCELFFTPNKKTIPD